MGLRKLTPSLISRASAIFLLAATIGWGTHAAATDPATSLAEGRKALSDGDLSKAHKAYASISFDSALWLEKSEDLLRYHLLRGSAEEAWRIVQVLRRIGDKRPVLNEYERLALFKSKACPLALAQGNSSHGHLLNAATYRLLLSRKMDSFEDQPNPGGSHLAAGLVPFLGEIPVTRLLKGRGCRFEKALAGSKNSLLKSEADELLTFISMQKDVDSIDVNANVLIVNRVLQIAKITYASTTQMAAARHLNALSQKIEWERLPDVDRRWVFRQLFGAGKLADVVPEKRREAQTIALRIAETEPTIAAADWLAMTELDQMTAAEKVRLLSRIQALGAFSGRDWLLVNLAWAHAERGETRDALALIRRLLLESEEKLDSELEASAVELASSLFSEHRFDERLQGAIHSSLPARLWLALLEDMQLRIALKGQRADFARIAGLIRLQKAKYPWRTSLVDLQRNLAARNLTQFRKHLSSASDRDLLDIAAKIAGRYPELSQRELNSLQSFSSELVSAIRKRIKPGDSRWDRITDVVHVLELDVTEWKIGAETVRKGTVQMGLARWRRPEMRKLPFELKVPETLPLHTLIFVPDSHGGREWRLAIDDP